MTLEGFVKSKGYYWLFNFHPHFRCTEFLQPEDTNTHTLIEPKLETMRTAVHCTKLILRVLSTNTIRI